MISADPNGVTLAKGAPQWQYVQLAEAALRPSLPPLPAPGRVSLDERRSAAMAAPLAGRVEQVLVRVGDRVNAGDRLFSVRSGDLAQLDKDRASAREQVATQERVVQRIEGLVQIGATPQKELQSAQAELSQARLALSAAEARRSSLKVRAQDATLFWVTAPRVGTVVETKVVSGQEISPSGGDPALRLSDLDEVLVLADVQEQDARDIRPGQQVRVRLGGSSDEGSPGVVEHVSEVVDPVRRAVEVRVRAPNKERALRPNAFVEVLLPEPEGVSRVRVPAEAVVMDGNRSVMFVERSPGRLERVPVSPGRQRDGQVELLSGIEPGTRFVSRGALLLLNQVELAD